MEPIKVLIADDVQIIRQGLKAILSQDGSVCVVATAANGKEACEKCGVFNPDVVLMDMRMPDYDGEYGIRAIKNQYKDIKVLVLTTFDDEATVHKAIESGADGYILKEMEDEQMITAIKNVYHGMSVFGSGIFQTVKSQVGKKIVGDSGSEDTYLSLISSEKIQFGEKEKMLIRLVAEGYDNKEIAGELFLAEGTVRNSISKLLEKVEAKDRTQLAVFAVKNGLDME